jgi:hypothetical protein
MLMLWFDGLTLLFITIRRRRRCRARPLEELARNIMIDNIIISIRNQYSPELPPGLPKE